MAEHGLRRHDRRTESPGSNHLERSFGNDNFLSGYTVDVSQAGMRLELAAKIGEGTLSTFELKA
jgi:hypothetical protein